MNHFEIKSAHKLEFDKILLKLSSFAISEGGKTLALTLCPYKHLADIEKAQKQTDAAITLICLLGRPSFVGIDDPGEIQARVKLGGILSMSELLKIAALLSAARTVKHYRIKDKTDISTEVDDLFYSLRPEKDLEEQILSIVISNDDVSDNASKELLSIRKQIKLNQNKIKDILSKIVQSSNATKILQEAIITQRNGRSVVPVKAEFKNDMPGITHDISASGATIFIEPLAIVEINNKISLLKTEEKKEIERILALLSLMVSEHSASISKSYEALVQLDFIFAKANYAIDIDAFPPLMNDSGEFIFRRARHPLLDKQTVVPIDIELGINFNALIITGPNTGGKTVALKTAGLLALMSQCGLHIPTAEDSTCAVCSNILVDIGDEQSIEQSLSTFSSHMMNIVEILNNYDHNSLILLDELGAGTDPSEGAAIAIAIVDDVLSTGARMIATTHYSELKIYALNTSGVENASCEFDIETLQPTYKLLIGLPGRSNAFAISQKIGLKGHIIDKAQSYLKGDETKLEEVIVNLDDMRRELENEKINLRKSREEYYFLSEKAKVDNDQFLFEQNVAKEAAQKEAREIIARAKKEVASIISKVRKRTTQEVEKPDGLELHEIHTDANTQLNQIGVFENAPNVRERISSHYNFLVGDTVSLRKMGITGSVLTAADKSGMVYVQAGILKLMIPAHELEPFESNASSADNNSVQIISRSIKNAEVATSLDIRGMSVENGLLDLVDFLDNAVRQNLGSATIIHGKGTGKLREAVRTHLNKNTFIKSFRSGIYGEGEDGVTIIEF